MSNITKTPSENTILFASLPPEIAVIINDVIHAIYLYCGWRQASKSFLAEILSRIAEDEFLELGHEDLSASLWPYLNLNRRREKFSRWIAVFKKDMELSKFDAVYIPKQKVTRSEGGGYRGHVTVYYRGKFWEIFKCVQFVAKKCDLLAMAKDKRRAEIRKIVYQALKEIGAVKIIREKKEKEKSEKSEKEKSASLPCKCDCVSCIHCASKSANASEAAGAEPVLSVQIERERARLREIEEEFVSIGQAMLNRGGRLSVADSKINAIATAARARLKAAVNHKDGRSDYAPMAGERAKGRAGLEAAIEGLSDALRAANQMEQHADVEWLRAIRTKIQMSVMFRNTATVKMNGGRAR